MRIKLPVLLHISKKTLVNSLFVTISRFANYILLFIFTMLNARTLGVVEYGRLSYYLAVIGIIAIFLTLGMDTYIVIQIAKDQSKANYYLNANFINRTMLAAVVSAVLLLGNCFINILDINWVSILLYITMLCDSFRTVTNGFFQAIEEMHYIAWFDSLRSLVLIIVFLLLRAQGLTIIGVAIAYLVSSLAALIPSLRTIGKKYQFKFQTVKLRDLKELLTNSFPFFLNAIVNILAMRIDLVMINRYLGNVETGYYNSAKKLYETTMIVPNIMTTILLPKLCNGSIERKKKKPLFLGIFIIGLLMGLILYFLAGFLVGILFGKEFHEAGLLLQILVAGIPLLFLNYFYGSLLAAVGARRELVLINACGTFINLGMNLLLIPIYQARGAALATILSVLLTYVMNAVFYNKVERPNSVILKF